MENLLTEYGSNLRDVDVSELPNKLVAKVIDYVLDNVAEQVTRLTVFVSCFISFFRVRLWSFLFTNFVHGEDAVGP